MKMYVTAGAAVAVSLLGAHLASAADLPARQVVIAPPPAPILTWTGFYAGAHLGAILDDSRVSLLPSGAFLTPAFVAGNPLRSPSFRNTRADVTGGGQVGYNLQFNQFVVGVEADVGHGISTDTAFNIALSAPLVGRFSGTVRSELNFYGTVRGRVGYAFEQLLVYGTGGFAYGDVKTSTNVVFSASGDNYVGNAARLQTGYTYGGGIEYKFTPAVSVRAEYLHVDLGSTRSTSAVPAGFAAVGVTYDTRRRTAFDVARVGLNYQFWTP
ncbi:hypothetical protein VQ02_14440 [Methylobacterium variabile]|jgi:outer membrane immunogenic protein|uniref:Outer membrane protein beta-barrel domain-containing protein n=1 Tax=Methylobacterium variabile TaxID=298794 RepID=A0A0J6STE0_9HYPH|nr:outer membrane beta-barrel protein [Methylobacterium variabile]KMO36984.1 hypothetical protein VQ02_14440 [Methylobacterium variabile]